MSGEITHEDLDHFERTLEALALELKITDEQMFNLLAIHGACISAAVDKERKRCAGIINDARGAGHTDLRTANARLIAAAPDLLEACASVWAALADNPDPLMQVLAVECRAAIAKATEQHQH